MSQVTVLGAGSWGTALAVLLAQNGNRVKLLSLIHISSVTVTGLLTGSCLLEGLKEIPPGSRVVIPQVMLEQQENRFLDNLTPEQVADKLQIELIIAPVDGKGFLDVILT